MKECSECKVNKPLNEFNKQKDSKCGYTSQCKECLNIKAIKARRTKEGKLRLIYNTQVQKSKQRGHKPPQYKKEEFVDKYLNNLDYERHYYSWVISNYSTKYSPSFDRTNESVGYSFDNIKIMYWFENKYKNYSDVRNGINNTKSKAVIGTNIRTREIIEFHSAMEAGRNGFHNSSISRCCNGERKSNKGYTWQYK